VPVRVRPQVPGVRARGHHQIANTTVRPNAHDLKYMLSTHY
jgi:hypothetical protein